MLQSSVFGVSGVARVRDGRRLYRVSRGAGSPTIVFEAGLGACRSTWGLVQPALAELTRTLAYDRAGLGRSEPDTAPRTVQRMAEDLEDLLDADGNAPYVLVAHSLGGPTVRCLGYRRPELLAGLVLVDQVSEHFEASYRPARINGVIAGYRVARLLARGGLLDKLFGASLSRPYPAEMAAELLKEQLSAATMATCAAEARAMPDGLRALLSTGRSAALPDVPVTVISGGKCGVAERRARPLLIAHHERFAAILPRGKHVIARHSGHLVSVHAPEIIIEETTELLLRVRTVAGPG